MPAARALVVSIHDVSPRTYADCRRIIAELRELGVERTSLLVIPDHHRRGHIAADPDFCTWLQTLENEGHEIVLHGYFHQRERRLGESTRTRLTTRFYTADEGEFYDLDEAAARELITRGLADLCAAGLHPHGFIAPAWLLSAPAEAALRTLGIDYTTRLATVSDLGGSALPWPSQSLVWSVRSRWRRVVSRGWNATLARRLRPNPLLRVSIHPVDIAHAAIWKQIRALTMDALQDRTPMTYLAWILATRASQLSTLNSQPS